MNFFISIRKSNFDTCQTSCETFLLPNFTSRNEDVFKHSVAEKPKQYDKNFARYFVKKMRMPQKNPDYKCADEQEDKESKFAFLFPFNKTELVRKIISNNF